MPPFICELVAREYITYMPQHIMPQHSRFAPAAAPARPAESAGLSSACGPIA